MKLPILRRVRRAIKYYSNKHPDMFLSKISGLIHVGANIGQERFVYGNYGISVVWIEPIPSVYKDLEENLESFKNQYSYRALITNMDNKEYKFNISTNNGKSSSILDFKRHSDIQKWSHIKYTTSIKLYSVTLPTLINQENINIENYQALVLDTQGSELLVLQGSLPILEHFNYIKIEVADFESYEGCCQLNDIETFMKRNGYKEYSRKRIMNDPDIGSYFDIVYKK